MSNRVLSFLVLVVVCTGLFGVYYYFFALSTGTLTLIINGSGTTSVTLTSEFKNSYSQACERTCVFQKIPAVQYTLQAQRDSYNPLTKNITLGRGETKKVVVAMEKEITLTEQKNKKDDTITAIKLKKEIQDLLNTHTGGIVLGYRSNNLYYALPGATSWDIFLKKVSEDPRLLFPTKPGILDADSLSIYEGYIALKNGKNTSFYALTDGQERIFKFPGNILSIKDTLSDDTKIITSDNGVYMYSLSENTARENPLYDDIIQLKTGEIVALVKASSKSKQSLLSIDDTSNDHVFLIGQDTRERKTLFTTPKHGRLLRYKNGVIQFVDEENEVFVVENVR